MDLEEEIKIALHNFECEKVEPQSMKTFITPSLNKNNYVNKMMKFLKMYVLFKKKIAEIVKEIEQIEKYGLAKSSKGILLFKGAGGKIDYLSEYEKKEKVLDFLKGRLEKSQVLLGDFENMFSWLECLTAFQVWKMKEVEKMSEKEIETTFNILGKPLKCKVSEYIRQLKFLLLPSEEERKRYVLL